MSGTFVVVDVDEERRETVVVIHWSAPSPCTAITIAAIPCLAERLTRALPPFFGALGKCLDGFSALGPLPIVCCTMVAAGGPVGQECGSFDAFARRARWTERNWATDSTPKHHEDNNEHVFVHDGCLDCRSVGFGGRSALRRRRPGHNPIECGADRKHGWARRERAGAQRIDGGWRILGGRQGWYGDSRTRRC